MLKKEVFISAVFKLQIFSKHYELKYFNSFLHLYTLLILTSYINIYMF
jgi:hypothetical protein